MLRHLWTQFFVGQIWGQSYQQKLVAWNPIILGLQCVRLVKRGNWNVLRFLKMIESKLVRLVQRENWNVWELFKERIETCETCPKRELKRVRVLEREIDSLHVTRNASKKICDVTWKKSSQWKFSRTRHPHMLHGWYHPNQVHMALDYLWNLQLKKKNLNFFGHKNMCFSSANSLILLMFWFYLFPKSWFPRTKF
jgi:hypothetical protein